MTLQTHEHDAPESIEVPSDAHGVTSLSPAEADTPENAPSVRAMAVSLIEPAIKPATRLVSFDIFETVLTRSVGDPSAAFLLIGQRLQEAGLIEASAESFARTRYVCEKRVRTNQRGREVTVQEVYQEIACSLELEDRLDRMIEIELTVERELIEVIPPMRDVVNAMRERFGRVIFISDMYLPHAFIESLLREHTLLQEGDTLYVSSTFGVQKGSGELFKIVLEQEKLSPDQLLHCGNSESYDILPAQKLGIASQHFCEGNPTASECVLNEHAAHTEAYTARLSGASRQARLGGLHLDADRRRAWDTGACVTGPLVQMYAQWVISRAQQLGITRLFFLARDAYLPFRAVEQELTRRPELGIQAKYIHGSRATYFSLDVQALDEAAWGKLTQRSGQVYKSPRDLQACLMTDEPTLTRCFEQLGFAIAGWDEDLTEAQLIQLKQLILEDPQWNHTMLLGIHAYQDVQRRYLRDSGFDPAHRSALVDTGWTTRSHAPFYDFLVREGHQSLRIFYIGLFVEKTYIPLDHIDTFMFNRATRTGAIRHGMDYPRCMETLFTSSHGRTERFEVEDGAVVPRFAKPEGRAFVEHYYDAYHGGVMAYLEQVDAIQAPAKPMYDLRCVAEEIVARFWKQPTKEEAALWSELTWEWDPMGRVTYRLARPYRVADAWPAFLQDRPPHPNPQFWVGAAKAMTPLPVLGVLKAAITARRVLNRVGSLIPRGIVNPITRLRRKVFHPNRALSLFLLGTSSLTAMNTVYQFCAGGAV